ncbi:Uncharacterised protein [Vibrio cholerae]|nr:Uncharacterised protein [Vibrio cholerae]
MVCLHAHANARGYAVVHQNDDDWQHESSYLKSLGVPALGWRLLIVQRRDSAPTHLAP